MPLQVWKLLSLFSIGYKMAGMKFTVKIFIALEWILSNHFSEASSFSAFSGWLFDYNCLINLTALWLCLPPLMHT